jgi:hypothetical protein
MGSDNPRGEPDNQQERPLSAWYVTGFMDGEGCFCVSIHQVPTRRGWYIGPVVQAYQHRDRADILERLRAFFGCGRIRPKGPNSSVVTWSVDGVPSIVENVLPHFDRYPLQSGKLQDYLVFREIVLRMLRKSIYAPTGFSSLRVLRSL